MKKDRPLRVLESFGAPRKTTNPYIWQLAQTLDDQPQCELLLFSFRRAIFGSYDVFHVHWPEVIYTGHGPLKSIARETLTALLTARLAVSRKRVVRTWHNIAPHANMTWRQRLLNRWIEGLTTHNIRLNEVTEPAPSVPTTTILHGHYRDWFAPYAAEAQIPGRIAFVGLIRRYKGVEHLIEAFGELDRPDLSLSISGKASTQELRDSLVDLGKGRPAIDFSFEYLTAAELVRTITRAELVVLPYTFMHNSGAALAALSLNRPVLVPDTEVNRKLSIEVGPGWVYFFSGNLQGVELDAALNARNANPPQNQPNLDARAWEKAGTEHVRVFARAVGCGRVPSGKTLHAGLGTR